MYPIIDLHADLLSYLAADEAHSPDDTEAIGCALPHLQAGGVKLQVCALFCLTEPGSTEKGMRQAEIFQELDAKGRLKAWKMQETRWEDILEEEAIYMIPAIESASVFAEEEEDIEKSLYRMEMLMGKIGKPLYISLTHHSANRFGGGNMTRTGLNPEGALLLEYLDKRDIAVDLSHTSAFLAHDIFKFIASRDLEVPLIASHSNFQSVTAHVRNLPDPYVEYLMKKGGIQGLNFIKDFLGGEDAEQLYAHFRHGQSLGASMAFAGDFFAPQLMPEEFRNPNGYFFPELETARVYPEIIKRLGEFMTDAEIRAICYGNALSFLRNLRYFDDPWAKAVRPRTPRGGA